MNESQKSKGQTRKPSRNFAVEIIARLAAGVRAAIRVLNGGWEHRKSKDNGGKSFGKSEQRDYVRGEEAKNNIDQHAGRDFEASTSPGPFSVSAGRGSETAAAGEHSTTNIQHSTSNEDRTAMLSGTAPAATGTARPATGEPDARAPRQHAPAGSLPHSEFQVPRSALSADPVSRQELKRELDSLRRLIESRK